MESPKAKKGKVELPEEQVSEVVQKANALAQENLDTLRPMELKAKLTEMQEAFKYLPHSESEKMITDLRSESERITMETTEFEKKLQSLREETERYKQLYADEVRKKIDDKALVETQRQVLAQASSPHKPVTSRTAAKPSPTKRI